jgi:hypothetical protein
MPILDANDPAFFEQYPNGATVYDAWGRRLHSVVACNPETGEVIRLRFTLHWRWWLSRWRLVRLPERRHGFWPAPLRVVPNPAHTHTIIKI